MDARTASNAALDRLAISRDNRETFRFRLADSFEDQPLAKAWLIKGIVARGETSAWIAPPGGMKSALMADLSIAVARGLDWHGHRSKQTAGVAYFALERADLARRRIAAHMRRLGLDPNAQDDLVNVAVVDSLVDLMDARIVPKVIATIDAMSSCFPTAVGLVVLDTFAKTIAAGGGDEDKAKDQGRVFAHLERIQGELRKYGGGGPHIAIVGHTGKDETRGARGSNAFYGHVDTLVTIGGDEIKTATVTKANDAPEGPLFSFKSQVFEFGTDEDGDPITVNIVSGEDVSVQSAPKPREPKLTANQKTVFAILHTAGAAGLALEDWNTQAKDAGIGTRRKADLTDARNALLSKGLVRHYGDRWTVVHS